MRRLSVTAAIVVLGALVFTAGAQACSCFERTPSESLRKADAAIVGTLVEVDPAGRYRADYRYRVGRVYKRGRGIRGGETISVRSAVDSAACGLPDTEGRRYGLFLNRGGGRWTGGLCGLVAPRELLAAARGSDGDQRRTAPAGSDGCAS